MADLYQPDADAFSGALDSIKLLSQRDLALRIPINYVPVTGTSIAAACAVGNVYDTTILAKCISNLLVSGFRRFVLDIYWDETRLQWSFCPVQLNGIDRANSTSTTASNYASVATLSTATLPDRGLITLPVDIERRQTVMTANATTSISSTTTPAAPANTASLVHVGPYACSPSANLNIFTSILASYLGITENNLNATSTYLTLNIHAAAGADLIARMPTTLPSNSSALHSVIADNVTAYLYTPMALRQQRANLNLTGSWFGVPESIVPDAAYFDIVNEVSQSTTPNGWPSDSYVEYSRANRLLVEFGNISREMARYDLAMDKETIFPPASLQGSYSHQLTSTGDVSSDCFFSTGTTQLSAVNNSWAVANVQATNAALAIHEASTLSSCGYTPVLNQTIDNVTAATTPQTYHQFLMGTIWSWDVDEPTDNANSSANFHCALLNATSGRWQVGSCTTSRYCACITSRPYNWQIGTEPLPYDTVDQACAQGSTFAVPSTALENRYLLDAWRRARTSNTISDELLFLNFNDLDQLSCWVIGQNTTCPYQEPQRDPNRIIVVPTVAAVIVFVLTVLTIFVKCAANRQNTKRRRRRGNDDSGDYEGVPA